MEAFGRFVFDLVWHTVWFEPILNGDRVSLIFLTFAVSLQNLSQPLMEYQSVTLFRGSSICDELW